MACSCSSCSLSIVSAWYRDSISLRSRKLYIAMEDDAEDAAPGDAASASRRSPGSATSLELFGPPNAASLASSAWHAKASRVGCIAATLSAQNMQHSISIGGSLPPISSDAIGAPSGADAIARTAQTWSVCRST